MGKGAGQVAGQQGKQGGKGGDPNKEGNKQGRPGDGLGGGIGQGLRPYHEIADPGFEAQKVRGKLQQGAITGLSHFRGQGAKGDAPVEFVEALKAAEQETSSSLWLDRIPADAREVVKDYFLKVREGANIKEEPPPAEAQPKNKEAPAQPAAAPKQKLQE